MSIRLRTVKNSTYKMIAYGVSKKIVQNGQKSVYSGGRSRRCKPCPTAYRYTPRVIFVRSSRA